MRYNNELTLYDGKERLNLSWGGKPDPVLGKAALMFVSYRRGDEPVIYCWLPWTIIIGQITDTASIYATTTVGNFVFDLTTEAVRLIDHWIGFCAINMTGLEIYG